MQVWIHTSLGYGSENRFLRDLWGFDCFQREGLDFDSGERRLGLSAPLIKHSKASLGLYSPGFVGPVYRDASESW